MINPGMDEEVNYRLQRIVDNYSADKILLGSDHHFSHANILRYCKRPFHDVHHMNRSFITQWNDQVDDTCLVIYLGDFAMGHKNTILHILPQLRGQRRWIVLGNHDRKRETNLATGFEEIHHALRLSFEGVDFNLSHYPYRGKEVDSRRFKQQLDDDGRWLLCGHVHQAWRMKDRQINVGWDAHHRLVTARELGDVVRTGNLPDMLSNYTER